MSRNERKKNPASVRASYLYKECGDGAKKGKRKVMVSKWQTSMGALRIESMFAVFARQDACHIEYISASTQWKHIVCKRLRSQAYAVYAFTAHCDRVRFSFRVFSLEFLFSFWLHQSS